MNEHQSISASEFKAKCLDILDQVASHKLEQVIWLSEAAALNETALTCIKEAKTMGGVYVSPVTV